MKTSDWVCDQLEHVRLVHFSMIVVSGTLLYMGWVAWSDAVEVTDQFRELRVVAKKMQDLEKEPTFLAEMMPDWTATYAKNIKIEFSRYLMPGQRESFDNRAAAATSAPRLNKESSPISEQLQLEDLREAIETAQWDVTVIDGFPESEGLNKLKEHGKFKVGQMSGLKAIHVKSDRECEIVINTIYYGLGPAEHGQSATVLEESIQLPCVTHTETIKLDDDWFEKKFEYLEPHWATVKDKTLNEAIKWAEERRTSPLAQQTPEVLGLKVQGADVGIVGPIVLFFMLLYLVAYVVNLNQSFETPSPIWNANTRLEAWRGIWAAFWSNPAPIADPASPPIWSLSPWVGSMRNRWAIAATWATLVFVPSVAVFLSLWRLAGLDFRFCLVLAGATCIVGAFTTLHGFVLSGQRVVASESGK